MTDLEMTKLCAEAIGKVPHASTRKEYQGVPVGVWLACHKYDPLHNDEQAMALVKKLKLTVSYEIDHWEAWNHLDNWHPSHIVGGDENINRAIVECVAKMRATDAQHSAGPSVSE